MTSKYWKALAIANEDKIREAIRACAVEAASDSASGMDNKVYLWPDGDVTTAWEQPNTWPANEHKLVAAIPDYNCHDMVNEEITVEEFRESLDNQDIADQVDEAWDEFIRDIDYDIMMQES